jgi:tetratricopeptide (TPR) repeat protein
MRTRFLSLLSLLLFFLHAHAQESKIDSMRQRLNGTLADTERVKTLNKLERLLSNSSRTEEALTLAQQSLLLAQKCGYKRGEMIARFNLGYFNDLRGHYDKAIPNYEAGLKVAAELKLKSNVISFDNSIGNCYLEQGLYQDAINHYKEGMARAEKNNDSRSIALLYGNIGNVYMSQGNYTEGLKHYLSALKIADANNFEDEKAQDYGAIAGVYFYQNQYELSLSYYKKAIEMYTKLDRKTELGPLHTNLGVLHRQLGKPELALEDYKTAISLCAETGDKKGGTDAYMHLGILYTSMKQYNKALENLNHSMATELEMHDEPGLTASYNALGDVYAGLKKYTEAIDFFRKSIAISDRTKDLQSAQASYTGLANVYSDMKNFELAYTNYSKATALKDTLINTDNNKQMTQMNILYQSEKKDKEIQLLNKDKTLKETEIKQQKAESDKRQLQRNAFIVGFILTGLSALFILRGYKQKQKANEIIARQKLEVEEKNKDITDSINYAKRIQDAILPEHEMRKKMFPDSFLLFKPKDIVSGDFYWMSEKNGKKILAVADCTGHGVPGAFMSMIGNAFLNEIVNERGITRPSEILDQLREMIISSLKQGEGENKDGMDIVLVAFDTALKTLEFAGANNPLWIIRKDAADPSLKPVLLEIKGDKQPVGFHKGESLSFTNHTVNLHASDFIYLFSDGFADQFGGPKGKKFKYKQLSELLQGHYTQSCEEQQKTLSNTLTNWKGNLEQVDDILLIGIRI